MTDKEMSAEEIEQEIVRLKWLLTFPEHQANPELILKAIELHELALGGIKWRANPQVWSEEEFDKRQKD